MQVDVYNQEQQKVGSVELPDDVFAVAVNESLLWEQVKAQRASARRGTHATKTRGEVSGGGAKPFKQKGTGRARQGSNRAPNHVGGGTIFGPQPRDYSYRLPRSARKSALRSALSVRTQHGQLLVLEDFSLEAPKTRVITDFLQKLTIPSALFVDVGNHSLHLSVRNLQKAKYIEATALNVYDILNHEKLVVTRQSLAHIVAKARAARIHAANAAID